MVPVWLEFTGVPLQFFNWEALQEIAGLVGHPVCLHPSTEKLTNTEVAKVYMVIDPRKPLPQFVNARFESGDTRHISVTSPWLPYLCSFSKQVGHTISRCSENLELVQRATPSSMKLLIARVLIRKGERVKRRSKAFFPLYR